MSVIPTNKWLETMHNQPIKLCKEISKYFSDHSTPKGIHYHLVTHGLYRKFLNKNGTWIKTLKENNIWRAIELEEKRLKETWDGPDVPIFILPADPYNPEIQQHFHGKSGLSFHDKIFLFISEHNTKNEVKALLTHEYNHVCRLDKYNKEASEYVLLDTVILEGLAENAVHERLGGNYTADWTTYYTEYKLKHLYNHLILPNRHVPKSHPKHQHILYGFGPFPDMAGYCVGYYLIQQYLKTYQLTTNDLLSINPELFILDKTDDAT